MELIVPGSLIAITSIAAYAVWKAHDIEDRLAQYSQDTRKQLDHADTVIWKQTRAYSEELEKKQKDILAQTEEYRKHHDRLMQALDEEHKVSKSTITKLTEYIERTEANLKAEIDNAFARYNGKVTQLEDTTQDIRTSIRDLQNTKADSKVIDQHFTEVYEYVDADLKDIDERLDTLGVHLNKATEDRLAKGERAILEQLRLGLKQKDIAKKLNTTEARVSKVKKKLQKLGLAD